MFERILAEQNTHWRGKKIETGFLREKLRQIIPYIDKKQILIITGIRRCGKSFLIRQMIDYLLAHKVNSKNVIFLNLESPYFDEFREKVIYLEQAFDEYLYLTEAKGRVIVFLDEVQFFKNWQVFVKAKYETERVKFILTGSNSWLLSSEYATLLSGRTIQFNLFPFSFREFLTAKGIDVSSNLKIAVHELAIKKVFTEFLEWGGFPEVILNNSIEQKKDILTNYYKNIIYRDIIPRFKISSIRQTEELCHYLISNIGKMHSYNQLSGLIGLSDKTIKDYLHYFMQAYLLFEVNKYSHSLKKQMVNLKKVYVSDVGFTSALGFRNSQDSGRFLENLVFIELLRRAKQVYYHKEKYECDFLVKAGNSISEVIQVCHEINDDNKKREFAGLREAMQVWGVKKGVILTFAQEEKLKGVSILPVWKWLLRADKD
ncbi:ATP-binding protein [Candidatus Woesearchaeota archaeon]|nr:ATP-binding protein [Candidatus Woesearchaeota archaeon]